MEKKVAIVTGASQGLGLALADRLTQAGYFVVGVHRGNRPEPNWGAVLARGLASEVIGTVSEEETAQKAFDEASRNGAIKLVVNCAGVGIYGPSGSYSRKAIDEVFEANLVGTIVFSERGIQAMRESGGTLVNIMSTAAAVGRANEAIYCASKWGARGYTESIRTELKGSKLRVMSVFPGGMKTAFWDSETGKATNSSKFMDPADVADTIIAALADHANSYVSDITINRG